MTIGGPFHDANRRQSPKKWYLSYFAPRKNPDGTIVLRDGKPVTKRHRPYYKTRDDAEADKPRIRAQYGAAGVSTAGSVLTREEAAEFERAKGIVPEASLVDLAQFWRKHHPLEAVKRIRELAPLFLVDVKSRLGETAHFEDLKSRVGTILVAQFGDRIPNTITRDEAIAWLRKFPAGAKTGRTLLNLKQAACNFFNWAKVAPNPFGGIKRRELPKIVTPEIGFLQLGFAEHYLHACERYDPELVAHEIVQLVAGVRADDEMANFDGSSVHSATHEIVIPAAIAKTGVREVINELEPAFWAWWKIYGREGILRPANYLNRWRRIRILATVTAERGVQAADELARAHSAFKLQARDELRPLLARWPWNARRRTFVTYHVAKYQSADKTALIIRHRGDTYTLHQSYRGLGVTRKQGEAYFALRPSPIKDPLRPPATREPRGIVRLRSIRQKPEKVAASA